MSSSGNSFTIGKDATLTILVAGQPIGALKLTNFEAKQLTSRLTTKPINGRPGYREVEEGWEGTCDWDRQSALLDDFFAAKEAGLYAGQRPPEMSIMQTIRELDGSRSRYRFTGVAVKLDDAGTYQSDGKVMQKMGWIANERVKV